MITDGELIYSLEGVHTLYDLLANAAREVGDKAYFGTRSNIREAFAWRTYDEVRYLSKFSIM